MRLVYFLREDGKHIAISVDHILSIVEGPERRTRQVTHIELSDGRRILIYGAFLEVLKKIEELDTFGG